MLVFCQDPGTTHIRFVGFIWCHLLTFSPFPHIFPKLVLLSARSPWLLSHSLVLQFLFFLSESISATQHPWLTFSIRKFKSLRVFSSIFVVYLRFARIFPPSILLSEPRFDIKVWSLHFESRIPQVSLRLDTTPIISFSRDPYKSLPSALSIKIFISTSWIIDFGYFVTITARPLFS